ncbi:acetoacetate--CoA ligase [Roseicella frigidaeris]|nr:acetoacetate--CoA ligase [Roseicella frigidaeris]
MPSQLRDFSDVLGRNVARQFSNYWELDRFSAEEFRQFWSCFLSWSNLPRSGDEATVCVGDAAETAVFFPDLRLNYAECLLQGPAGAPVLTACHGIGLAATERLTRGELRSRVARLAAALRRLGVAPGDRVAAVARNNAEMIVVALAAAAVGAVLANCTPDMGSVALRARLAPLAPRVVFANLEPMPWDRGQPLAERVVELLAALPSVAAVIALDAGDLAAPRAVPLHHLRRLVRAGAEEWHAWPHLPFNHPLVVLFSSGTTGQPKCILHGAGGTLIEHLKEHRLHCDLRPGDRMFFQTSCGWMMWNWQLSALASGAEILVYDGPLESPALFWQLVAAHGVTVFGTNPAYLQHCEAAGLTPGRDHDLHQLRLVLSTGSPLRPRQFAWVAEAVKPLPLHSISGGTDVIGCFVLGHPSLPVHAGESPCRSLGLDIRALPRPEAATDRQGTAQQETAQQETARQGELICANPFPSRPLGFFGETDGRRFHESYFAANPGVWTHGDLVEHTPRGGWTVLGRSDSVLKIRGIRVGPAEIYAILESFEDIAEAMAVAQEAEEEPGGQRLVLLVVLRPGRRLDPDLARRIRRALGQRGASHLVPGRILAVDALPLTQSGKRSEAAARDAVNGRAARNRDALRNPECLASITASIGAGPRCRDTSQGTGPHGAEADPMAARLTALCESILDLPELGPADDLLELGADSLRMLSLLLAVEREFGQRLSVTALFSAPTIDGLLAQLRGRSPAAPGVVAKAAGAPRIRPVTPADLEPLARLLAAGFGESGIGPAQWRHLFGPPWPDDGGSWGWLLTVDEAIVGVLGTVRARHPLRGDAPLCNLSSWYVHPDYRGWGSALLVAALGEADATWTSFTPSSLSLQALAALDFRRLDTARIFLPPLAHAETLAAPGLRIDCAPATVRGLLDPAERQVFDDHAPFDCLQMVARDATERAYLVLKRRRDPLPGGLRRLPLRVAYSELLYCSAPALLARHLERIKLAVLARQRTLGLVVDARLWATPPRGRRLSSHAMFRSARLGAEAVDKLYSELVLLPV